MYEILTLLFAVGQKHHYSDIYSHHLDSAAENPCRPFCGCRLISGLGSVSGFSRYIQARTYTRANIPLLYAISLEQIQRTAKVIQPGT